MRYTVIEAFVTPLRRFFAGMEVEHADVDGPVSAERRIELGQLKAVEGSSAEPEPEPEPAPEPAADPAPEPAPDPAAEPASEAAPEDTANSGWHS